MNDVEKEPESITREFKGILEPCFFCKIPTKMWHKKSNTPICTVCAMKKTESDLPK